MLARLDWMWEDVLFVCYVMFVKKVEAETLILDWINGWKIHIKNMK